MSLLSSPLAPAGRPEAGAVITKAVIRAADALGVTARLLAEVIGVSEASVSRMRKADYTLDAGSKPFELAVLFVRLFRALDAIVGGDAAAARAWMQAENTALGGIPAQRIRTISGLVDVIAYLDARRARV
ncbi:MbcA/ParS/Xre antitoxin family protein [Azorhizobium doebereinerae]|uniref:MbcA/ParS/Xre antitoxin family protein n=1 Tax=Azorhizobium doebereinerae TaxID=281091 RepID=UPI000417B6EE|nr:MbcA/ParS/Xre antitoxin family protein [Azorhizobium doebereinerae]